MANKKFLTIIFISILLLAPLLFVSTAEASTKQPKGSKVANEFIEGKTDKEVRELLNDAITIWQAGDDLVVKSEYEILELPRTAFTFDVDATMKEFKQKTKRKITSFFMKPKNVHVPLHVKVNPSNDKVQEINKLEYIDTNQTFTDATIIASELGTGDVNISYTNESQIPFQSVSEVTIDLDDITDDTLEQSLYDLDNHKIGASDSFSFIQNFRLDQNSKNIQDEASFVAGKMYNLFLQTNFQIAERSIHTTPPAHSKPGLDVRIDVKNNKDLIVVNPNDISFIFKVEEVDHEVTISLTTAHHNYSYDVELEEKEIEPRTIYRYSDKLAYGEEEIIQQGVPGMSVILQRLTYDERNDLRNTEFISQDIYTLLPTIILVSTTDEETAQEETMEEQVDELEDTINEFEKELAKVREEAAANAEASEVITSLAEQLEVIQDQQAEFMRLIVALQEQMDENEDSSYTIQDEIEKRLTAIDERLETLEMKMDELDTPSD